MKRCCVCGKPITYTFWVCAGCEDKYGLTGVRYAEWPEWVKMLQRTYRRQKTIDRREIAFSTMASFDPLEL